MVQSQQPFGEFAFVKGLYLVKIAVDGPNTLADLYLRVGFLLFNATGNSVSVNIVEGTIAASTGTGRERHELGILPPPRLEDAVTLPLLKNTS